MGVATKSVLGVHQTIKPMENRIRATLRPNSTGRHLESIFFHPSVEGGACESQILRRAADIALMLPQHFP